MVFNHLTIGKTHGKLKSAGALLAMAALSAVPYFSQNRRKEPSQFKATGCVRKGVEGGCLLLTTLDGQTTYNIFATPPPEPGIIIAIEGKPHSGPTACIKAPLLT